MINKIVVSVVAGFSLLGTTLVAAQCPPNLNTEDVISCIVAEGAGETYLRTKQTIEIAKATPVAAAQIDQASTDNGLWTPAQNSYE